jgi:hypothetical protein
MQTETRYRVEAHNRYTREYIETTRQEFRTLDQAREYERHLGTGEGYKVHVFEITYPANRITLTLNADQVDALYRAIKIHNMSYEGVDEKELDGTGVLEAITELQKIETKLDRATGNN